MNLTDLTSLGRAVEQQPAYSRSVLVAITRALSRQSLGMGDTLPFVGGDRWTGYELSWLAPSGVPQVAVLKAWVPAHSPALIESKSFKLYLNSYARLRMPDIHAVRAQIAADLSATAGVTVEVELLAPPRWSELQPITRDGVCIDTLNLVIDDAAKDVQPHWLRNRDEQHVEQTLVSHLLKSNCPVTGQPDWASVYIGYRGPAIDAEGLLRYLVSFRDVREFHEQCVERIYLDLLARCAPEQLCVEARYTRRGGLDINPVRASSAELIASDLRDWRQ